MKPILLFLLLCSSSFAQSPLVLFAPGDVLPSGAVVEFIEVADVDSSGRWLALLQTSTGSSLVSSEGAELVEGGPVPGMPGATSSGLSRAARDDQGNSYCKLVANYPDGSFERIVLRNFTAPVISSIDLLTGPGFQGNENLQAIDQIEVNAGGDLIVVGKVFAPSQTPNSFDAIVQFEIVGGLVVSAALVVDGSQPPAGQAGIINVFSTLEDSAVLGDGGDLLWTGNIVGSPDFNVAYANPNDLLAQDGQPSPVPGRNWDTPFFATVEVNAGGARLLSANLEGSAATDQVYVLDGQAILQEGDSAPALPGASYVILGTNPQLTDGGELIHTARLSGQQFSQDRMLLADNEILAREGLTITADGRTLQMLELSAIRASADGRWILFEGRLVGDSASSLMLLERAPEIGQAYCSAETNSTGSAAVTRATGSADVADQDFRLLCDGMPVQQPGFFLASLTQADVPFAGGSQGRLCLGGTIARFNASVQNSGAGGSIAIVVDLTAIPLTPAVAVQPGETWNFQTWYRDMNPGQTSNFALPVAVSFQ